MSVLDTIVKANMKRWGTGLIPISKSASIDPSMAACSDFGELIQINRILIGEGPM